MAGIHVAHVVCVGHREGALGLAAIAGLGRARTDRTIMPRAVPDVGDGVLRTIGERELGVLGKGHIGVQRFAIHSDHHAAVDQLVVGLQIHDLGRPPTRAGCAGVGQHGHGLLEGGLVIDRAVGCIGLQRVQCRCQVGVGGALKNLVAHMRVSILAREDGLRRVNGSAINVRARLGAHANLIDIAVVVQVFQEDRALAVADGGGGAVEFAYRGSHFWFLLRRWWVTAKLCALCWATGPLAKAGISQWGNVRSPDVVVPLRRFTARPLAPVRAG